MPLRTMTVTVSIEKGQVVLALLPCLTTWFFKKQTSHVISTTEADYISTIKACQQAPWIKQALVKLRKST